MDPRPASTGPPRRGANRDTVRSSRGSRHEHGVHRSFHVRRLRLHEPCRAERVLAGAMGGRTTRLHAPAPPRRATVTSRQGSAGSTRRTSATSGRSALVPLSSDADPHQWRPDHREGDTDSDPFGQSVSSAGRGKQQEDPETQDRQDDEQPDLDPVFLFMFGARYPSVRPSTARESRRPRTLRI